MGSFLVYSFVLHYSWIATLHRSLTGSANPQVQGWVSEQVADMHGFKSPDKQQKALQSPPPHQWTPLGTCMPDPSPHSSPTPSAPSRGRPEVSWIGDLGVCGDQSINEPSGD